MNSKRGLTLIELMMVISVFAILSAGMMTFIGRSFEISREQFEQVRITDDARFQMERMGDAIRDAQFIDCNGDGETDTPVEHWLQAANENSIMFYTNFDDEAGMELVRYFTEPGVSQRKTIIYRGIRQLNSDCTSNGAEEIKILIQTLRNADETPPTPLFRYFATGSDSTEMSSPISLTEVRRVRLQLVVDESEVQFPTDIRLTTDLSPRSVACDSEDGCGILACIDAGETYAEYNYTDDFAGQGYSDCKNRCATNENLPAGQCCSWAASIDLAYEGEPYLVGVACQCRGASFKGPATDFPDPNVSGEYTDFARECFDGTRCGAGISGLPICDAGCLEQPGECYCECPG